MPLTPPESCVTSLGTLTAGSITTQAGSWDRDDACRSVHRTSSQQTRFYARYYTFTLSEATDVRLRLASSEGKYLYLLAGSGTGGRVITSVSSSSGTTATVTRTLQAGTYTIEAATYSRRRRATSGCRSIRTRRHPRRRVSQRWAPWRRGRSPPRRGRGTATTGAYPPTPRRPRRRATTPATTPSPSRRRPMCVCGWPAARAGACISCGAPARMATWSPRRPPAVARLPPLLVCCRRAPTRSRPPPSTRPAKRTSRC